MDSYQAIYDAVRSRINPFNLDPDVIYSKFDISFAVQQVQQDIQYWAGRPSVWYRPKLSIDGNKWCALYGDNLQDGIVGFGNSPAEAMTSFDANWIKKLERTEQ